MTDTQKGKGSDGEVETALLDAELFLKYQAPERAVKRLRVALESKPRSVELRERLREIAFTKFPEEAARQCLALASLYIQREDFDTARERLLEAKQLDARINIASGLEAIRRASRPDLQRAETPAAQKDAATTLAGDLSAISLFDLIQVLENSRLTGALVVEGGTQTGRILFNEGRIVGADTSHATGEDAFRKLIEANNGSFNFERTPQEFPVTIQALSNTNLLLDSLRQLDEEKEGK
ncbi:MAG: DUF4388 domain-containing protein, partial [Pyrinomonadaceae bacterium]